MTRLGAIGCAGLLLAAVLVGSLTGAVVDSGVTAMVRVLGVLHHRLSNSMSRSATLRNPLESTRSAMVTTSVPAARVPPPL